MSNPEAREGAPPPSFDSKLLPASAQIGENVRMYAHHVSLGENVIIGDDALIVGDEVTIGTDVSIGRDCEIRASTIRLGDSSEIHDGVRIFVADNFSTGEAARLAKGTSIFCRNFTAGRLLYLGDGASVGYGGTMSSSAIVRIGDRVTIGQHTILNANCPIEVGDNVGTGSYLAIWTHGYHFGHGPLDGSEVAYAPVRIGRNVWLGFHVTILPGVSIGDNTIVAAGSVVTSELPADVLAAGAPARVKKSIERCKVAGEKAHAAVVKVLQIWRTELQWKGCNVKLAREDTGYLELVVALADSSERTHVVLLDHNHPVPSLPSGAALIIVTVDDRSELFKLDPTLVTVFVLRDGKMHGRTSPIVEDLRDQLRRHAMPCGDTSCFTSIEPGPFARLRKATSGQVASSTSGVQ